LTPDVTVVQVAVVTALLAVAVVHHLPLVGVGVVITLLERMTAVTGTLNDVIATAPGARMTETGK